MEKPHTSDVETRDQMITSLREKLNDKDQELNVS